MSGADPCHRRGPGSWAAPNHAVPAPPRHEAPQLLFGHLCPFCSNLGPFLYPQPAGASGEGKKQATGMASRQVGMCVQVRPPQGPPTAAP